VTMLDGRMVVSEDCVRRLGTGEHDRGRQFLECVINDARTRRSACSIGRQAAHQVGRSLQRLTP
jgi:hypothetical protein